MAETRSQPCWYVAALHDPSDGRRTMTWEEEHGSPQQGECADGAERGASPDAAMKARQKAGAVEQAPLEQQLADARTALAEMERKYLYAVADLQNYKRRMQRELADRMQFANEQLLRDLLPLLDNFRLAVESSPTQGDAAGVLAGVGMILQQFEDLLHSHGVEQVAAEPGTEFDPSLHEAVVRVDAGTELRGKIVEELARGYTFRDRLLRPAKVKAGAVPLEAGESGQRPEEAKGAASEQEQN